MTLETFFKMNPSVGSDCGGLVQGTYYCISTFPGGVPVGINGDSGDGGSSTSGQPVPPPTTTTEQPPSTTTGGGDTPSPTQSGLAENCNSFYKVVKGDGCADIAKEHKIELSDFYKWNPAIGNDCSMLLYDFYVCVGVTSA